jgi:hypothetical protein
MRQPPKEFVVERFARGETAGDLPKNCHLLPFVAICSRKTVTPLSIDPFLS